MLTIHKIVIFMVIFLISSLPIYAYATYMDVTIAPQEIEFHMEDSVGNITGYTPTGILKQIPNISTYHKAMTPNIDESFLEYYDRYHYITQNGVPTQVPAGKYRIVIFGYNIPIIAKIDMGYGISNQGYARDNNIFKIIYPQSIWTYEFEILNFPPINHQITLTKISQPSELIKDLTTAGQLGYIGSSKFITELVKEINEIEAEKAKGKVDDGLTPAQKAKKEYTELLSEITEKYNKPEVDEFVKQEAYTVLKEDLEYIINHIQ